IQGRVAYQHNDSPVADAVVEIYQITPEDEKLSAREIIRRRERLAACVTAKDGRFCFSELPSGNYVVRAGTSSANAGMNDIYLKVRLDRRWWTRWFRSGRDITLGLTPGT